MNHVDFATTNLIANRTFPAHWGSQRAGLLFRQVSEPNHEGLPVLSVSIHDGISDRQLDDDERDRKVNLIEDRSSYQRLRPGYLAYNMMRAWQGAIGLSSVDGAVSPAYVVARPTIEIHSSYYQYLLRTPSFIEQMRQRSKGIADFRLRLYWEQFKEILLPVPPLDEQRAITEFLDRKTARIDQLIQKKLRLADLISARWTALIHEARNEPEVRYLRFGIVASRAQRAIPSSSENSYTPLGLLNRGRGFFKKLESDDDHLGDSDFFWVRRGDIVFSGQFAWEGAIGLVRESEDGCVVSHRYPIYRSNPSYS
jgi:Type I restriction modification DNA specificity domain